MLEGKEFCIVNGPETHSKSLLEKKVVEVFLIFYIHFLNNCTMQSQKDFTLLPSEWRHADTEPRTRHILRHC